MTIFPKLVWFTFYIMCDQKRNGNRFYIDTKWMKFCLRDWKCFCSDIKPSVFSTEVKKNFTKTFARKKIFLLLFSRNAVSFFKLSLKRALNQGEKKRRIYIERVILSFCLSLSVFLCVRCITWDNMREKTIQRFLPRSN